MVDGARIVYSSNSQRMLVDSAHDVGGGLADFAGVRVLCCSLGDWNHLLRAHLPLEVDFPFLSSFFSLFFVLKLLRSLVRDKGRHRTVIRTILTISV